MSANACPRCHTSSGSAGTSWSRSRSCSRSESSRRTALSHVSARRGERCCSFFTACSASLMPAQERGWPWSVRWNSSRRTRSRSPKWSTISSGDHLPGAIGRLAFAIASPWIAALTAARARASSNSSSSRDVASARCAANAVVIAGPTAACAARATAARGRGAAARRGARTRSVGRVRARGFGAARLLTTRFAARFGALARGAAPAFFFDRTRRLAPARGLSERALLALRPAFLRLDCFFPAARATRCPRSVGRPRGGRPRLMLPPGISSPESGAARGDRERAPVGTLRCDGVRHRRVLVHPATALPAQPAGGHVLLDQRTRPELLAERPVQEAKDAEARVEPDQVHELERSHRVVQSQLQRLVDVGCARHALLQHVERLVADHGIDAAGDEAGRLAHGHALLAHLPPHLLALCER